MVFVSLAAAAGVVAVMEYWLRAAGLKHNPVLAAVLLFTTWLFAHTAITDATAMLTVLFSTLSLRTFFIVYKNSAPNGGNLYNTISHTDVQSSANLAQADTVISKRETRDLLLAKTAHTDIAQYLKITSYYRAVKAFLPLWLFGSMLCGGVAGLVAPLTGIAAFVIIKREWRHAGRWFGLREILIFVVLCLLWLELRWDGSLVFTPAPREHLFWYLPRLLRDMLPWTPVYLIFITLGVWRKKLRSDIARFLYTAIWANIVVMSLISSKSEFYLLPIYPLAAYLTAALLRRRKKAQR